MTMMMMMMMMHKPHAGEHKDLIGLTNPCRLGITVANTMCLKYSNQETSVSIGESVRDEDVFIVQSVAPGQVNEFDPHFAWDPRHDSGQTRFSFDLKVSAGAHGFVEWRDAAQPYRPGPRLAWDGEQLTAGGRDVGSLPVDTWVRVTMASGVGADKTATWSLTIAPYGGAAREYTDLPPMDAAWDSLRWLGFSSTADTATTLWLDNLTLEHIP